MKSDSEANPWAAETERQGIDDFWAVEGRHSEQLRDLLFQSLAQDAEIGPWLHGSADDRGLAERAHWADAWTSARRGSWETYHAALQQHGKRYASRGLSIRASGESMRLLARDLIPCLVDELARDPARLTLALRAMSQLVHHASRVIAEAYVEYQQGELHAREVDLATTLDSIGDAVVVTDAEGRVTRLNPVAERLTGFPISDCRGRPLAEIFQIENEDTGAPVESPVLRVLREGAVVGLANHTVLVSRDGARRPIADSGAPVRTKTGEIRGVVLVFRDVTEERRAEQALRHWERVFQHASWGVALADVKDVTFQAVNPAYASMHGYTVEELVGAPVSTLWAENTKADMERHARETHQHGHLVAETTHKRKDGTTLPVEVVATTIKDATGKVAWFVANVQDITERRRLQQSRIRAIELEARNKRIEEANRLKSEFLANMSHELRTPLNSIIGFTELLHDEQVGELAPKQKEFLADILAGGRHLLRLINDVLDLAKVEAGKMEFRPEPVDLERLVSTVVQSLRASVFEKRLSVNVSIDPTLTDVVLDPGRFKQILYNYLSNALKFTRDESPVSVRLVADEGDAFRLEVEDSGPGIAEEQLPHLFVAFQQLESATTPRHAGTGLGLALTRRLAEAQGGTVGVRPAPGGGSTFFAVLPRRTSTTTQPRERSPGPPSVPSLLVLEADELARTAIVNSLLDAGYEVDAVGNVAQAQRRLEEQPYDALVLNLDIENIETLLAALSDYPRPTPLPLIGISSVVRTPEPPLSVIVATPASEEHLLTALARSGAPAPRGRPILVVDDDAGSLRLMEVTLSNLGFDAICFSDPNAALAALQRLRPAAAIVDIIMPGMDGLAFLERFRASEGSANVPVMFWTVKDLTAEERLAFRSSVDLVVQKGVGDGSRLSAALKDFLPEHSKRKER